jgi:hypothetical protein
MNEWMSHAVLLYLFPNDNTESVISWCEPPPPLFQGWSVFTTTNTISFSIDRPSIVSESGPDVVTRTSTLTQNLRFIFAIVRKWKHFFLDFASCVKNVFLAFCPNKNVLFRGYIDLLSHTFFLGIQSQRYSTRFRTWKFHLGMKEHIQCFESRFTCLFFMIVLDTM